MSVTSGFEWMGLSSLSSDVCWTPRLVAWAELMREVGFLVKSKEENESYLTGFVALSFVGLLDFEESKVDKSDVSGGCACVRAPTVVALLSRIQLVCEVGQAEGKAAKICS